MLYFILHPQEEYHALKKVDAISKAEIFSVLSNGQSELSHLFNEQISHTDCNIQDTKSKFDVYVSNVEALKRLYNDLSTDKLNQKSSELLDQLQQSQDELKRKEDAIFSKEVELEQLREENFQMHTLIAHHEKKLTSLEIEYQSKLDHLQQQLEDASERNLSLDQALKVSKAAAEEAKTSTAKATEGYASLASEKERLVRQLEERRAAVKAGDLRNQNLENQVWSLKDNIKELQILLKERDEVTLDLENQLSSAENKLERSEEAHRNNDTLQKRITDLEEELQLVRSDVEAREWRIEDLVTQVNDLRTALKESERETLDYKRRTAETTHQLTEMAALRAADIEEGLATLRKVGEEVTVLKAAAGKKDTEAAMLKQQLKVLQRTEKASAPGNEPLQQEVHHLQKQVVILEKTLKDAHKAAANKASADAAVIQEFERRVVEAEQRAADAHQENARAIDKTQKLKAWKNNFSSELFAMKSQLLCLQQELSAKEAANRAALEVASKETDAAKKALLSALNDMKSMKTDDQVEEQLEQQSATLRAEHVVSLEEFAASRQAELDSAVEKSAALESRLKDVIAEKVALEEALHSAMEQADEQHSTYERETKQLKEERSALMAVIDELQEALKGVEERYQKSMDALKKDLAVSNGKIQATESLIDQLAAKAKLRDSMPFPGKENHNATMDKKSSSSFVTAAGKQGKKQGYRGAVLRNMSNNC